MTKNFRKPIDFVRAGEGNPQAVVLKAPDAPNPAPQAPQEARKAVQAPKAKPAKPKAIEGPWLTANPRIIMQFNVRMPEPLHAKLRWLGENTTDSMHAIALQAIEEVVNKRVRLLSDASVDYIKIKDD